MRYLVSSGSPYEARLGFSRAVRVGPIIAVSGTAPIGCDGDAAQQAAQCLEIIRTALHEAGASLAQVTRTRVLLLHIEDWEAVGQVHGKVFGDIRPTTTVMQVSRFIDPKWLVEIEADAVMSYEPEGSRG